MEENKENLTRVILSESVTFRHLFSRLNTEVVVYPKDMPKIRGILKTIDLRRMYAEIETSDRVYFTNLHRIVAIETRKVVL